VAIDRSEPDRIGESLHLAAEQILSEQGKALDYTAEDYSRALRVAGKGS
jgi:hypothetical protein